jgi:hydroxymethylbilane synthase
VSSFRGISNCRLRAESARLLAARSPIAAIIAPPPSVKYGSQLRLPVNNRRLRLGTRNSLLARWQANWVSAQLAGLGIDVELVLIVTGGDADQRPIGAIGGEGVFTKEIQRALLENRVDLAVHSLKDLPTEQAPGLALAAVPRRESPFDAAVVRGDLPLCELPDGARVGTGSLRRRSQLLWLRPDLHIEDIRGNVDTRLGKLDSGNYDAIILAEAGLRRLGWGERISEVLPPSKMMPAVGQGALGIECRASDEKVRDILAKLDDAGARQSVCAERALLARLHGGCSAPIGAWGRVVQGQLQLDAVVLSADGHHRVSSHSTGHMNDPDQVADSAARELLNQGAENLIASARGG